jgi:hypothetical protein
VYAPEWNNCGVYNPFRNVSVSRVGRPTIKIPPPLRQTTIHTFARPYLAVSDPFQAACFGSVENSLPTPQLSFKARNWQQRK